MWLIKHLGDSRLASMGPRLKRNILFGDSAVDEASNDLQPVLAIRSVSRAAIYRGNMYYQSDYVDVNFPHVGVDGHAISASSSYLPYSYEQRPIEDRRFYT